MPREKKAVDYIRALCSSHVEKKSALGEMLKTHYEDWVNSLDLYAFLKFVETIYENKAEIGAAQFFGKFRAYAFEEYIYRLLKSRVHVPDALQIFWGEKCLVWKGGKGKYLMEFDISIGKKVEDYVEPSIVFDAKVELDSARLKIAVASFAILKKWKPNVKCVVAYIVKEVDSALLKLAWPWVDGIFQFDAKNNESEAFTKFVVKCLEY
ncbi:MAG: hypothetical protein QW667_00865 [Candidatus Bathyarchaeia archaeon]